jgi:colicin import membrane protein
LASSLFEPDAIMTMLRPTHILLACSLTGLVACGADSKREVEQANQQTLDAQRQADAAAQELARTKAELDMAQQQAHSAQQMLEAKQKTDEERAKAELAAKQKAEVDAKAKAELEAKQKAALDAQQKTDAKTKAELEAKIKAELDAKQKADAKAKTELEAKQKAELEAKIRAELEAKQKAEAKAKAELEAKQKAELDKKNNPATEQALETAKQKLASIENETKSTWRALPAAQREALQAEQKLWRQQREATCKAKASNEPNLTARSLSINLCRIELTEQRNAVLRARLEASLQGQHLPAPTNNPNINVIQQGLQLLQQVQTAQQQR